MNNFDHIKEGDEVKVSRGRQPEQIGTVGRVTAKQFNVIGYGRFWKKNGYALGNSTAWYGAYARPIQIGDREKFAKQKEVTANRNLFSGFRVRDFNDTELAAVADIIRAANKRMDG